MPELPEVETVRGQLAWSLTGKIFATVGQIEPSMLRDCTPDEVRLRLPGRRVEGIERLGKFIVMTLAGDTFLTLHLGMTGQLLIDPRDGSGRHTRFVLRLVGEPPAGGGAAPWTTLEFRDSRKFGRLHLTAGGPAPRLRGLGPDAWRGEWDACYLTEKLRNRKVAIKAFLLDQRHLSGIGNIYADEILWWTGISPLRASGSLTFDEIDRLCGEIPRRLGEGVRLLGCSMSDYVDTAGESGGFQDWLRAYGKNGQKCSRCGETLVRAVIGGRGTTHCPGCQT